MKAYADLKHWTKPHSLNIRDHTLVKHRIQNKASPHFEPVPDTILDVKGSTITAKRTTDQKLVTRNSSFFKKLPNPLEEAIQESSQYLRWNYQPFLILMDQNPLNTLKRPAMQEEFCQATPSETNPVKDSYLPTTVEQPTPSLPARFSSSGRWIRKPEWTKDYVMD